MGDTGQALRYAAEAEQIFRARRLLTEAARLRWTIAYATLVSGNLVDAALRLQSVVGQLTELRMESDAALAKVDLVEAYVALGRFTEAWRLASDILRYFKTHDMLTGALTAAAFVEEAAKQKRLTPAQVSRVRDYLKRLSEEPQLVFVAPK
jgi:hypothetical protein